ncbi:unnamed protein product [Ilex paraguariensis]|uniref:Uncharacterized protein n=1 Tax=Ilex paraguariensis TaxID=185542 RepID=A0ABC8RY71_9AQUA
MMILVFVALRAAVFQAQELGFKIVVGERDSIILSSIFKASSIGTGHIHRLLDKLNKQHTGWPRKASILHLQIQPTLACHRTGKYL